MAIDDAVGVGQKSADWPGAYTLSEKIYKFRI
jgi:hypothetical protein